MLVSENKKHATEIGRHQSLKASCYDFFYETVEKMSGFSIQDNQTYSNFQNKKMLVIFSEIGNVSFQYLRFMLFCFLFIFVFIFLFIFLFIFIQISYLAASRPPLGYWRGGSLTHPILVTAQLLIRPEGQWKSFGSRSPVKRINETETGNLLILK